MTEIASIELPDNAPLITAVMHGDRDAYGHVLFDMTVDIADALRANPDVTDDQMSGLVGWAAALITYATADFFRYGCEGLMAGVNQYREQEGREPLSFADLWQQYLAIHNAQT